MWTPSASHGAREHAIRVPQRASAAHHRTVLDGTDPQDVMPSAFRYVTFTKPSLDDCIRIFGPGLPPEEYIERFHRWGARYVVMSRGGDSALVSDGETITELP